MTTCILWIQVSDLIQFMWQLDLSINVMFLYFFGIIQIVFLATSKKELLWKWMGFHFLNDKVLGLLLYVSTVYCFFSIRITSVHENLDLWFIQVSFCLFFFLTRTCLHCQLKNRFQNWVGSSPQKPKQDGFVSEEKNLKHVVTVLNVKALLGNTILTFY